jgi:rhodanese-related sulfurtransferase
MQQQTQTTTPEALYESVENGEAVTIIDVRQPHEFERNHIEHPNATVVNIPLNQLQTLDPQKLTEDVPTENVVAVCASGNRSSFATQMLNRAGIPTQNLAYGMQGWLQVAS